MSALDWTGSLQTNGGVRVKVIEGPTFSGTQDESDAGWKVLIQKADFDNFLLELFPVPFIVTSGGSLWSVRDPNMRLPGSATLYAKSYSAKPFERQIADPLSADPANPSNTYADVLEMDLTFATDSFGKVEGDEQQDPQNKETIFDDHSIEVGGQFLTIGDSAIKWDVAPFPNDELSIGVTKQVPLSMHTLSRKRVLNPDWATIRTALGKLNGVALTKANFGFDAKIETVLFSGVSGRRIGGRTGQALWDMGYKLAHREFQDDDGVTDVTWNHFFRPKAAAGKPNWQVLKTVKNNQKVYATVADLADIFKSVNS
jgi:hypothetical protein